MSNIFTRTISFALQESIERHESNKEDSTVYELLKRAKEVCDKLEIYGLDISMSYDDFCAQLEEKKNIIFLSDGGMKEQEKVRKLIKVLKDLCILED
jgi:hypothetical protein